MTGPVPLLAGLSRRVCLSCRMADPPPGADLHAGPGSPGRPGGRLPGLRPAADRLRPPSLFRVAGTLRTRSPPPRPAPYCLRSPARLARFFDGLHLVEPGLVSVSRWRPGISSAGGTPPAEIDAYGGVGYEP